MNFNFKIKPLRAAVIFSLMVLGSSCSTDDISSESVIKDSTATPNEVDLWIAENLTKPYNIEVVYKWDDEETDLAKNLVPPDKDKVIPFLQIVKELWLKQYEGIAGGAFIKQLTPKQILLVGSPNINTDGTVTEGTAEGGRKIILYSVNSFDAANKVQVKKMIHVIHHEFAHIMHQTEAFDVSYNQITPGGYTSTWYNVSAQDALNKGFITSYAQSNVNEDFSEMVSNFVISTPAEWKTMVNTAQNQTAKDAIKAKELKVADYFLRVWNIDIYQFQIQVSNRIAELTK